MDAFLQAAALVFTPTSLIYMFLGVFFGILCGRCPAYLPLWRSPFYSRLLFPLIKQAL